MKITDVRATKISNESWGEFVEFPLLSAMSKYPEYKNAEGENPQALRKWIGPVGDVFVEVETDAGITGYGQANWGTGAIATIVEETLSKLVEGADPLRREYLWEKMFRATLPFGRKGAAIEAISAVDVALWDIAGQEAEKPVYELLGGAVTEEIPCYASNLHPVTFETLEEEAIDYVEQGFDAMKLRLRHGPEAGRQGMKENEKIVRTVRDAVGDEVDIAVDVYQGWTVRYAKKMVDRLERYDLAWVEEPVPAHDVDGYAELREHAPMDISGGEHEFTRWGHRDLLEAGAVDILQPDIHRTGGITEMKKIADMAETYDVPVIPHSGTKPHLHFIAAHTNAPMAEYFPIPCWYEQDGEDRDSTYADALYENPPQAENGTIPLPESSGVGLQINRDALEYFAVE
jgi:L-alanine-DL-glutamate epimerase-like enolase superfamily enzyme